MNSNKLKSLLRRAWQSVKSWKEKWPKRSARSQESRIGMCRQFSFVRVNLIAFPRHLWPSTAARLRVFEILVLMMPGMICRRLLSEKIGGWPGPGCYFFCEQVCPFTRASWWLKLWRNTQPRRRWHFAWIAFDLSTGASVGTICN